MVCEMCPLGPGGVSGDKPGMATFVQGLLRGLRHRLPAAWPNLALAVSVAMLATAHAFERLGGYAPCLLCLKQREVYWVAGALSLATVLVLRTPVGRQARPWLALALGGVFLFGAGLAAYHAGVEWKWWPGPESCAGSVGSVSDLDLSGLLDGTLKVAPPACEEAAWRLLGLSMAGWNVLVSLTLAGAGLLAWRLDGEKE